jgi:hypothetical protein
MCHVFFTHLSRQAISTADDQICTTTKICQKVNDAKQQPPREHNTDHYIYQLVMLLKKVGVMQTILEIMENNILKWYGHVLQMGDTRRHK